MRQAASNRPGAISLLERRDEDAFGASLEQIGKPILALEQRLVAKIIATDGNQIEGVKLCLVVVTARMKRVEVGIALQVGDARLAVDDKLRGSQLARHLDDLWKAPRPIEAALGDQPHVLAVADQASTVAIEFDLVEPIGTGRHRLAGNRLAKFK
jgi:hypothetical protein